MRSGKGTWFRRVARLVRVHPYTLLGAVSLVCFWLAATGAVPFRQPWHALMVPAYLLQSVLGALILTVLPFARGSGLGLDMVYVLILLPLYFGLLLGADRVLVWRDARRESGR